MNLEPCVPAQIWPETVNLARRGFEILTALAYIGEVVSPARLCPRPRGVWRTARPPFDVRPRKLVLIPFSSWRTRWRGSRPPATLPSDAWARWKGVAGPVKAWEASVAPPNRPPGADLGLLRLGVPSARLRRPDKGGGRASRDAGQYSSLRLAYVRARLGPTTQRPGGGRMRQPRRGSVILSASGIYEEGARQRAENGREPDLKVGESPPDFASSVWTWKTLSQCNGNRAPARL